jgi:hypothetical protein
LHAYDTMAVSSCVHLILNRLCQNVEHKIISWLFMGIWIYDEKTVVFSYFRAKHYVDLLRLFSVSIGIDRV